MSSPSTGPTGDSSGIAKIAASATRIKKGFLIPTKKKVAKANQYTDKEWKLVFRLMKTMPIPDIAKLPEVNMSASRMYEVSRRLNIPRIQRIPKRLSADGRTHIALVQQFDPTPYLNAWKR